MKRNIGFAAGQGKRSALVYRHRACQVREPATFTRSSDLARRDAVAEIPLREGECLAIRSASNTFNRG